MPQFNQFGFNAGAFSSDSVGSLPASGSSSLTINLIRSKLRPVGLSGSSSLGITFQVNRASAMVVPGSGQFNQFGFNEENFGAAPASLLNVTGSSWLSIAIQKELYRSLSVQGFSSSSLIVRRVRRSASVCSGYGTVYIRCRRRRCFSLVLNGSSFLSILPVRRGTVHPAVTGSSTITMVVRCIRRKAMGVSGQSQATLFIHRNRHSSGATSGYAFTAIQIRKRKSSAMPVWGTSFTHIAPSRARARPNVSTAGNSSIHIKILRKRSRGLVFIGTNRVGIRVVKPTLSPLITTGLRVSNTGRPNMQASIRIAHSTRPSSAVNLRFTRWTAPV